MAFDADDADSSLAQLQSDLNTVVKKEPNADVDGAARDAIEAIAKAVAGLVPDHPVVSAIVGKVPFPKLTAKDALVVVGQLRAALPSSGPYIA